MYGNHADLLAVLVQVVDGFTRRFSGAAHEDDDAVGILGTVIGEKVVFAACYLGDLSQIIFYNLRNVIIILVAGFSVGEEGFWIFCGSSCHRPLWRQGAVAEALDVGLVDQRQQVFFVELFNFLVLVRGAEAVEEVDKRHLCLQ